MENYKINIVTNIEDARKQFEEFNKTLKESIELVERLREVLKFNDNIKIEKK